MKRSTIKKNRQKYDAILFGAETQRATSSAVKEDRKQANEWDGSRERRRGCEEKGEENEKNYRYEQRKRARESGKNRM